METKLSTGEKNFQGFLNVINAENVVENDIIDNNRGGKEETPEEDSISMEELIEAVKNSWYGKHTRDVYKRDTKAYMRKNQTLLNYGRNREGRVAQDFKFMLGKGRNT